MLMRFFALLGLLMLVGPSTARSEDNASPTIQRPPSWYTPEARLYRDGTGEQIRRWHHDLFLDVHRRFGLRGHDAIDELVPWFDRLARAEALLEPWAWLVPDGMALHARIAAANQSEGGDGGDPLLMVPLGLAVPRCGGNVEYFFLPFPPSAVVAAGEKLMDDERLPPAYRAWLGGFMIKSGLLSKGGRASRMRERIVDEILAGLRADAYEGENGEVALWTLIGGQLHEACEPLARLRETMDAENLGTPWLRDMVAAEHHETIGWHARGHSFANTVKEEGRKVFGEEMKRRHQRLLEAQAREPGRPHAASELIFSSMLNDGRPREWFAKAVAIEFDFIPAYTQYRQTMLPRWSGPSWEPLRDFALECLATERFDTVIPINFCHSFATAQRDVRDYIKDDPERLDAELRRFHEPPAIQAAFARLWAGLDAEPFWQGEYAPYRHALQLTWENGHDLDAARAARAKVDRRKPAWGPPWLEGSHFSRYEVGQFCERFDTVLGPRGEAWKALFAEDAKKGDERDPARILELGHALLAAEKADPNVIPANLGSILWIVGRTRIDRENASLADPSKKRARNHVYRFFLDKREFENASLLANSDLWPGWVVGQETPGELFVYANYYRDANDLAAWMRRGLTPAMRAKNGGNGLTLAAEARDEKSMHILLEAGADPNLPDGRGLTPLTACGLHDFAEGVTMLLDAGADPLRRNGKGQTAAEAFKKHKALRAAEALDNHRVPVTVPQEEF